MLYFDQCNIMVDNSGLLADSVSLNAQTNIQPIYGIGKRGIFNQSPEGPTEGNINISYFLNLQKEPIFPITATLKNLTGNYNGATIIIGGITGYQCYLTEYQIKNVPNQLTKVSASFVTFKPFSGMLRNRVSGEVAMSGFSGYLAHGWTTQILSGTSYLTAPIYDFGYSFNVEWQPIYVLGNQLSNDVILSKMTEQVSFIRDTYHHIQFSGEEATKTSSNAFLQKNSNNEINLLPYIFVSDTGAGSPSITISLSGFRIRNSELNAQADDFVRTSVEATKHY